MSKHFFDCWIEQHVIPITRVSANFEDHKSSYECKGRLVNSGMRARVVIVSSTSKVINAFGSFMLHVFFSLTNCMNAFYRLQ